VPEVTTNTKYVTIFPNSIIILLYLISGKEY
jgi:hypothetical protein